MERWTHRVGAPAFATMLVWGVLATPGGGHAQTMPNDTMALDDETAKAHFQAGRGHYTAGRFVDAATEFMKAYELSKKPELLYNAYVAYRDAGVDEPQAEALRRYLAAVPDAPDRVKLEARLKTLEEGIATKKAEDEAARAELARREAEAADRARAEAEAKQRAEADRSRAEESASEGPGIWPWVVVGVGGAAIVGGVVTGVLALGAKSDLEEDCPEDRCPPGTDLDDRKSEVSLLAGMTDGLIIGGAVVAGAGFLWWFLTEGDEAPPEGRADTGARFVGGCTGTGCQGGVSWRF